MNHMHVVRHLFYILVRILEQFQLREIFSDDDGKDSMTNDRDHALHSYHF